MTTAGGRRAGLCGFLKHERGPRMMPCDAQPIATGPVEYRLRDDLACPFCGNNDPHYLGIDGEWMVCLADGEHYQVPFGVLAPGHDPDEPLDTDMETFEAGIRAMIQEHRERHR
jgi:hypothetical protein